MSAARLDAWLVANGHAASRARAQDLIAQGVVRVNGRLATKASTRVEADSEVCLEASDHAWVGRGALKLLDALERLPMQLADTIVADLGASTGGFTQVALARGAVRVYAVDVGHGQLAPSLANDPRVISLEGTNVRDLHALPETVTRIVADLSFISLEHVFPTIARLLPRGGEAIVLVKPQFEVGRAQLGKGGKVRDDAARSDAITKATALARETGLALLGQTDCGIAGAKSGNVEHFVWLKRVPSPTSD